MLSEPIVVIQEELLDAAVQLFESTLEQWYRDCDNIEEAALDGLEYDMFGYAGKARSAIIHMQLIWHKLDSASKRGFVARLMLREGERS